MAITLNHKTKLTTQVEKLFVEAGCGAPDTSLSAQELAIALVHTINTLAKKRSPLLLKIYRQLEKAGEVPPL